MKSKYLSSVVLTLAIVGAILVSGCVEQKPTTLEEKALSVCEKIDPIYGRYTLCTAVVESNSTKCENLDGSPQQICYLHIAILTKDSSLCEKAGSMKNKCITLVNKDPRYCIYDECYFELALSTGDVSFCEYISKIPGGDITCKAAIKRDANICENFSSDTSNITAPEKENCYLNVVLMGGGDASLCDKLSSPDAKSICVAVTKKDIESLDCCKFTTTCNHIAIISEDASLCQERIYCKDRGTTLMNEECYIGVALKIIGIPLNLISYS